MTPGPATSTAAPSRWVGAAVAVLVAAAAWPLAALSSLLAPAVIAAFLGVAVAWASPRVASAVAPGAGRTAKLVLQAAIVVLGATLVPRDLLIGWQPAVVIAGAVVTAWVVVLWVRRLVGLDPETGLLLGAGTAICGATAVAATASVLRSRADTVTSALAAVLLCNLAAVLVFPPIGRAIGLSGAAFGVWAATAVNDTSSVLAAASAYGPEALEVAVVVKLARTLVLIPLILVLAATRARQDPASVGKRPTLVPRFLVWFLLATALQAVGLVPEAATPVLRTLATAGITVALAAFGLGADRHAVLSGGPRALVVGVAGWISVAAVTLGLLFATGVA